jgi:ribosomal protein L37AE/L43A
MTYILNPRNPIAKKLLKAALKREREALSGPAQRPPEPEACPTCGGNEAPRIFTQVLGWECRACRLYRQEHHTSPANRLKESK